MGKGARGAFLGFPNASKYLVDELKWSVYSIWLNPLFGSRTYLKYQEPSGLEHKRLPETIRNTYFRRAVASNHTSGVVMNAEGGVVG